MSSSKSKPLKIKAEIIPPEGDTPWSPVPTVNIDFHVLESYLQKIKDDGYVPTKITLVMPKECGRIYGIPAEFELVE